MGFNRQYELHEWPIYKNFPMDSARELITIRKERQIRRFFGVREQIRDGELEHEKINLGCSLYA